MKSTRFYGWRVLAVCMLIMGSIFSLRLHCMGLFQAPVTAELGISRSQFSMLGMITSLSGMALSPLAGKALGKWKIRYIMTAAAAICSLSYASLSLAREAWHLYLSALFMGCSYVFLTNVPVTILMNRWFVKKRGLVISLAFAGSSIGTSILSPVVTRLISSIGWRNAFLLLGLGMCLLLVPSIFLVIRDSPEEKKLTAYGAQEAHHSASAPSRGLPLATLRKTPVFWVFVIGIIAVALTLGCSHHLPSHVTDVGFSAETAAFIVSLYSFVAIFAKLIMGAVFDRFGLIAGLLLGTVSMFFTFVSLLAGHSMGFLIAAAFCYGMGSSCGTILPPVMTERMFGGKYYGENYGLVHAFVSLCMGVNNLLFAAAYDSTGSYTTAWIGGAILAVLGTALLLRSVRGSRRLMAKTHEEMPGQPASV